MAEEKTILEWILELVGNEEEYTRFSADPETYIRNSDLTDRQRYVLLSRDPVRIRAVIEYELKVGPDQPDGFMMHLIFGPQMHLKYDPPRS
jgi:hypothetical protein